MPTARTPWVFSWLGRGGGRGHVSPLAFALTRLPRVTTYSSTVKTTLLVQRLV